MPLKWAIIILLPILIQFNAGCLFIGNNNLPGSVAPNSTILTTPEPSSPAFHRIITIPQDSPQADYVIMDRDIYTVGDIIRFSLQNTGSTTLECSYCYHLPDFSLLKLLDNGTYQDLIAPTGYCLAAFGNLPPGYKSGEFTIDTSAYEPGYYEIVFHCGDVRRNFELRDRH